MEHKQSDALERVMDLVRFLRANCPWDAAQTHRSLIPYLLEETHETADAIADEDDAALRAELGDLLLNVAFQLVLAEERLAFDAGDVADTVIAKMQRRHPHLYGGEPVDWETLKARERDESASILHGIARGLDPLSKAHRIQDRVAAIGFDWADISGALDKVGEELEEVTRELNDGVAPASADGNGALEEEVGDLLFAVVNVARLTGVHARTALHAANTKFSRRFEALERLAAQRDIPLETAGLPELDRLWNEIKASER